MASDLRFVQGLLTHIFDRWDKVLLPIIDRFRAKGQTIVVRADAAFALPALYAALKRRGVRYAIGRLIRYARYFTLQLAESYLTGSLFRQILQRIERLA